MALFRTIGLSDIVTLDIFGTLNTAYKSSSTDMPIHVGLNMYHTYLGRENG